MFTQYPFLLQLQQFLIRFELANPWLHPIWFLEDVTLLSTWLAEDYLFPSPVLGVCLIVVSCYLIIYAIIRIRRSHLRYIALGPGRQPSNVIGWLKHTFWEFLLLRVFRVDVLSKPYIHPNMTMCTAILSLPQRERPRPEIVGLGPLAQKDDANPLAMVLAGQAFQGHSQDKPDIWRATIEPRTGPPTLSFNLPQTSLHNRLNNMREWGDLVAEARPDGSMTVFLHPSDAWEVIRKGWGQRNPLAAMHEVWLYRFIYHIFGIPTPLHHGAVIIYAPLDERESFVAHNLILDAALWYKEQFPTHPSI